MTWLVLALGALIAFVNGANDVGKGVATLVGSGVTNYRRALLWGTAWTGAGAIAASALGGALLTTFGRGLLAPHAVPTLAATIATLVGAAVWVLLATRTGLPVSTTHAIVGSLAGVALLAYGAAAVRWSALGSKIVLPLVLSPVASLALTAALARAARGLHGQSPAPVDCLCAEVSPAGLLAPAPSGSSAFGSIEAGAKLSVFVGSSDGCAAAGPTAARVSIDTLHWITSGATSLARGLNDAPKMVALVLAASALAPTSAGSAAGFAAVTLGMIGGSALGGLRVTSVLAERVTTLDHERGFLANVVTSVLVGIGAVAGLPMSTTHVSSGAIVGASPAGGLQLATVRSMLLAWLVTVPAAAVLGMGSYLGIQAVARIGG